MLLLAAEPELSLTHMKIILSSTPQGSEVMVKYTWTGSLAQGSFIWGNTSSIRCVTVSFPFSLLGSVSKI